MARTVCRVTCGCGWLHCGAYGDGGVRPEMGRSWNSSFRIPVSMSASLMILVFVMFMIAFVIANSIMGVELKKLTLGLKNFSTFHKRAGTNHTHSGVAELDFYDSKDT
jgi:hypothetical protein